MKDVFTTSDVANICRVSTRIVTKWYDAGELKGYRLPGSKHRRFTRDQIQSFMAQNEMPLDWLAQAIVQKANKKLKISKPITGEPVERCFDE